MTSINTGSNGHEEINIVDFIANTELGRTMTPEQIVMAAQALKIGMGGAEGMEDEDMVNIRASIAEVVGNA